MKQIDTAQHQENMAQCSIMRSERVFLVVQQGDYAGLNMCRLESILDINLFYFYYAAFLLHFRNKTNVSEIKQVFLLILRFKANKKGDRVGSPCFESFFVSFMLQQLLLAKPIRMTYCCSFYGMKQYHQ